MNNRVPSHYPEIPEEAKRELRLIDGIVIPACIEGEELAIVTPKIGGIALEPSYAEINNTLFTIYKSKEDCWEDAYYDAWYFNELNRYDLNLLVDIAIQNVKDIEWWKR